MGGPPSDTSGGRSTASFPPVARAGHGRARGTEGPPTDRGRRRTTSCPIPGTSSSDGSFTSTTPRGLQPQFGTCPATARVTNTTSEEKSGVVTYTLFRGDEQVGTLQGAANAVGAGKTATVQLTSTESCPRGSLRYEFQVDAEF